YHEKPKKWRPISGLWHHEDGKGARLHARDKQSFRSGNQAMVRFGRSHLLDRIGPVERHSAAARALAGRGEIQAPSYPSTHAGKGGDPSDGETNQSARKENDEE